MAEEKRSLTKYEADKIKKENLQQSKMEISIYSPMFAPVIESIEKRIKACAGYLEGDEFEEGRISIVIDIIADEKEAQNIINPETNTVENRKYKAPHIKYNTILKLVIKDQVKDDTTFEKLEIVKEDGKYIARPLQDAQIKIEDVVAQQKLEG